MITRKYVAEAIGTFWLTFGGCGSAVIAAGFPEVGIGLLGVALAFGLTVLTMAYTIGHISGCHLNPAVTVGLAVGGRFPTNDIVPYVVAQVIGAIVAAALLYLIASGTADFDLAKGFAANGYGAHSPGKYNLASCLVAELVLTMMFLHHHGLYPWKSAGWLCADRHRSRPHAYPSHQHPDHQHLGESGAQHGSCPVRRWMGAGAIVAVLGGAINRRSDRRLCLPLAQRRTLRPGHWL